MWGKLDEVLGAGMLTAIAGGAMYLGYDHGLAQAAVAGIVALLAVHAGSGNGGSTTG